MESNFTLELKSTSGLLPVLRIRVSVQLVIILVLFFSLVSYLGQFIANVYEIIATHFRGRRYAN